MKFNIPILLYSGKDTNANFAYYSGLGLSLYDHSFLLLDGKEKILLVSEMNEKLARENFKGKVMVYENLKKELKKLLRGRIIGVDERSLNVKIYRRIRTVSKPKDVSKELLKIRSKKKPIEVEKIKKAVKHTKEIIHSVDLKKCKTEKDVERKLLKETMERGLEVAFRPIVASGRNTAFPHYTPRKVRLRDIVLIDYGVKYEGYCGDITRCFILNKGPWEKDYELVKQVVEEIIDEVKNCNDSSGLVNFVNKLYKKYKLPKQLHTLGHGIGLDVHEFPKFKKKSKDSLKNTVFTVEPGIYRKKWGARFEDCIWFDGKKAKIL